MTTNLSERTFTGLSLNVVLPDPDKIANEPIRKALELTIKSYTNMEGIRQERNAAKNELGQAKGKAELEAAQMMIEGGKLPKGMRKAIKAAEEVYEDSELEAGAATTAYHHSYNVLVAVVEANGAAWRVEALKDATRSLNLLAAARKSLENATAEASTALGILGMLNLNKTREAPLLALARGPHEVYLSQALPLLTDAIGVVVSTIEELKRG